LVKQDKDVIYEKNFYKGVPMLHNLYMGLYLKELKILVDGGADIYRKVPLWCATESKPPPIEASIYDLSLLSPVFVWMGWNVMAATAPSAYEKRDDLKEMAAFIASVVKSKK